MDNLIDNSTGELLKQHPLMRTSITLNELGKALAVAHIHL